MKTLCQVLVLAMLLQIPAAYAGPADVQEMLKLKKTEIDGHEWAIKLNPASGKGTPVEDKILFKDSRFQSEKLTKEGYNPTNFTLSLQEGGPTIWETMQQNEKGQTIFWRGEWEGETMRGVMSKQVGEGKSEDYYFSSTGTKPIEKVVEEAIPAEVPAAAEAVPAAVEEAAAPAAEAAVEAVPAAAAPAVEAPKEEAAPKKKKWF